MDGGTMMKALDWIFKIGLLVIGFLFIGIYFSSSQNGRYQYIRDETSGLFPIILDTKTGIMHRPSAAVDDVAHLDLINKKLNFDRVVREDKRAENEDNRLGQ